MRVLSSIVQSLVRSMLHARHHLSLRRFVALQLIRHNHPWHEALFFQEFTEKSLGCIGIPPPLEQHIQYIPLCVHCPPQVVLLPLDRDHRFIKMPFVRNVRTLAAKLMGILLPELLTPLPNLFRKSPRSPDTASFSQCRDSSKERCHTARHSS